MLEEIINYKKKELEKRKKEISLDIIIKGLSLLSNQPKAKDMVGLLKGKERINVIAEIKRKSPSRGYINENIDPIDIAIEYEKGGASAISILTDHHFFGGDIEEMTMVKRSVDIPILRKDFIFDEYQIYESCSYEADCVLLIAKILTQEELSKFLVILHHFDMSALCEAYDEEDLEKILSTDAKIIGINNRNLQTLEVDIENSVRLASKIPSDRIIVAESGIKSRRDIEYLKQTAGINCFLVGEYLMEPGEKTTSERLKGLIYGN
ncbi:MAG: indole-3-glycerol phosphate synthase TrpC [Campylobacterota bacterium]|nr:indole-3-glycerol phosphate synthase TrpC [Campylobacterota bacterium]